MKTPNNAVRLKREILLQTVQTILEHQPLQKLEEIPYKIIPDDFNSYRCCIHKDRAVIRSRILSVLGYGSENITPGPVFLAEYAEKALKRKSPLKEPVTVIKDACSSCTETGYKVTENCRGCLARPCLSICPVNAVSFKNGKSVIDKSKCINCGKCATVCPFSAIIKETAPCTQACPANAIEKKSDGTAEINRDKCISCGMCITACPFAAAVEKSQIIDIASKLQQEQKITILLAPSLRGQFPGTPAQLYKALEQAGFNKVVEISEAAQQCAELESEELLHKLKAGESFMTTSCCPGWINYAEKHLPAMNKFISDTPSPMAIAAEAEKKCNPENIILFAGPCTAKKTEAMRLKNVDYVITFEELAMFLVASNIDVLETEAEEHIEKFPEGTGFAAAGGVTKAVRKVLEADNAKNTTEAEVKPFQINGLTKKNRAMLKAASLGKNIGNFYEVMACDGGCIAGPGTICPAETAAKHLPKN